MLLHRALRTPRRAAALLAVTLAMALAALLPGCGGGGGAATPPAAPADLSVAFFGNSHTQWHDVPGLVRQLLQAAEPSRSVATATAPGLLFLDERLADAASLALLQGQPWQATVLQAQRYSLSGQVEYSTAEAQAWVRMTRAAGGVPVLFAEWPRRGIDESARIFTLYTSIARAEPACVPPSPPACDLAAAQHPAIVLHAADGNHASPAGALLAALLLASTLGGHAPTDFPNLAAAPVDGATQAVLRDVAAQAARQVSPWAWCPADQP